MSAQPSHRTRRLGGLLLWYGVLGGAVAWAAHLLAAWSLDELTCATGAEHISGVPLGPVIGLAVLIPALVTAGSLLVAGVAWRRTRQAEQADAEDPAFARTRLLAGLGIWANLLFLSIIVLGGIAVLVLPPCQR